VRDLVPYLNTLASQAHAEGGWGYAPVQPAHLEPTCVALLALSSERERFASVIEQARAALKKCAEPDGSYRLTRGREEAVWPTALVLFVQTVFNDPEEERLRTASRLLALRGRVPDKSQAVEIHDIDTDIVGWPWAEGNFSWAEPTAWACLALRKAGHGQHPHVEEGLRMLLDRTFDDGGVNYGNRLILGRRTEPIPGPTALALLALQPGAEGVQGRSGEGASGNGAANGNGHAHAGAGTQHSVLSTQYSKIAASVQYLIQRAPLGDDLEHLCWTKIALDVYRDEPGVSEFLTVLDERILAAHEARGTTNWVRPHPLRQALTALALGTDRANVFGLQIADCRLQTSKQTAICNLQSAIRKKPLGERLRSAFRGLAINALGNLRALPAKTGVHIARAESYDADLAAVVQKQYEHFRTAVPLAGKRVVLKPNLVEYHRDKVINTQPKVVAAVIELCKKEGAAEVIVAEGPGHWRNVEYLVSASGLGDVLREHNVPFVDLNHDEPMKTPNLGRCTGLEYLYLTKTIASADVLISLPKLKTHHWAGATLSLKNLFGTLPGICYGWPKNELHWRGIDNSIVDIALTRTPDLAVVDGIIGMEGDGPLNGTAKPMGILVMGNDCLAVDATCCRLMRLDPERIGYLVLGARKKLGLFAAGQIEQLGEKIEAVAQPFATVPHLEKVGIGKSA
jgi:uncharacterized protein (DUF362 family)